MKIYKEGEVNQAGWEIVEVTMKPEYKIRKKIIITDNNSEHFNEKGWFYFHLGHKWFELEGLPGKTFRFKEEEYDFLD